MALVTETCIKPSSGLPKLLQWNANPLPEPVSWPPGLDFFLLDIHSPLGRSQNLSSLSPPYVHSFWLEHLSPPPLFVPEGGAGRDLVGPVTSLPISSSNMAHGTPRCSLCNQGTDEESRLQQPTWLTSGINLDYRSHHLISRLGSKLFGEVIC